MSIRFADAGDGVSVVTLDRPERMNALDVASKRALAEIWQRAESDDTVRALVVHGAGERAFCAGSDLHEIRSTGSMVTTALLADAIPGMGITLTKPVVASLHGFVIGMGLTLAIHCDVRIAGADARFAFPEAQHGMLSGVSAVMLPGIVGEAVALDLMLTGRRIDAQEALRIGLVHRVVAEPLEDAMRTARQLAASSTLAVRLTKRLILAERTRRFQQHVALIDECRTAVTESIEYRSALTGEAAS